MPAFGLVEYEQAPAEVREVYDDIMRTRGVDWISNFWKSIAHDPALLRRTWTTLKETMAPGALDPFTKELLYLAVSASNQCHYCIASHTAASLKAGMTAGMFAELMAVVGMANETNRLVSGYQVEVDARFQRGDAGWPKFPEPRAVVERHWRERGVAAERVLAQGEWISALVAGAPAMYRVVQGEIVERYEA